MMSAYTRRVLDALNIREGAGHLECVIDKNGCCLIEVGARCHGCEGSFAPQADRIWGYNQVDCLVSATMSQEEFDAIPDEIGPEIEYSFKIDFVSPVEGTLIKIDHVDEIKRMKSYMRFDVMPEPGIYLHKTIDCFTPAGSVTLSHKDRKIVDADHQRIRELEKTMFVVDANGKAKKEASGRF